ncbi:hypothetical protein D3C85_1478110 [compost metagenome]
MMRLEILSLGLKYSKAASTMDAAIGQLAWMMSRATKQKKDRRRYAWVILINETFSFTLS